MPIRPLPPVPTRDDPINFALKGDAFLAALPGFVDDANALEQSMQLQATVGTSTSSLTVGSGSKTLTASTGKAWVVGAWVYVFASAAVSNYMVGRVAAYNATTGALTVNVSAIDGSGTYSAWIIGLATPQIDTHLLPRDGSRAMTAELLLAANAVNALGAVTKQQLDASPGRLLAVRVFTTANSGQTYTPTAGTTSVVVEAVGGGGAGGGVAATGTGQTSLSLGGGSGAYGMSRYTSGFSGVTLTVGAGGTPVAGVAGGSGGTTSFGALLSCPGGPGSGGGLAVATAQNFSSVGSPYPSPPSGANINQSIGTGKPGVICLSGWGYLAGSGADSPLGSGGQGIGGSGSAQTGSGYGSGGSGVANDPNSAARAGGAGAPGVIIVWEYA